MVSKQQRDDAMIRIMDPLIEFDEKTNDLSVIATYFEEQDARERQTARRAFEAAQEGFDDYDGEENYCGQTPLYRSFEEYERTVEGGSSPSPDAAAEKAGR